MVECQEMPGDVTTIPECYMFIVLVRPILSRKQANAVFVSHPCLSMPSLVQSLNLLPRSGVVSTWLLAIS